MNQLTTKSIHWTRSSVVQGMVLFLIGCAAIWPAAAEAQAEAGASPIWLSLGLGAGSRISGSSDPGDDGFGPAGLAEVGMLRGSHRLSLRASFVTAIFGDGASDFGFLYGRTWPEDIYPRRSVAGGISIVDAADCPGLFSGGPCVSEYTVGLPLSAELAMYSGDNFGFGIHTFGNVNGIASFAGLTLIAQLGRLR